MKRIVFNLKREWYDRISSGEKTVEYRRVCMHWAKRLNQAYFQKDGHWKMVPFYPSEHGPDWHAVFRLGYLRKYPDIVRRITKIDIGPCPYEGWAGDWFRIHFGKDNVE